MGNYIIKFRVPPPTPDDDERNHPSYYDWSVPKWQPFLEDEKEVCAIVRPKETLNGGGTEFKDALTSTVDTNSNKPPNVDTHNASETTKSSVDPNQGKASQPTSGPKEASIKRIDSTRAHKVDPKKHGDVESQAAAKMATNIHATKNVKRQST